MRVRLVRWLTRLLLAAMLAGAVRAESGSWHTAWSASPSERATPDMRLGDAIIEQSVRLSAGGSTIRLRFSHAAGTEPIRVEHVSVDGHPVNFAGASAALIPPRVTIWSDPLPLTVEAEAIVTVRFSLPDRAALPTIHWYGNGEGWVTHGKERRPLPHRVLLSAIDVAEGGSRGTIVTLGDSLTDGSTAPAGELARWPDVLGQMLRAAGHPYAVANAGVGGDRLLADAGHTGTSPGILGRLDSDVFALSSPRVLILLAGTNDIGWPGATLRGRELAPALSLPPAQRLIDGYQQVIRRARDKGMLVILCTIPPMADRQGLLRGFATLEKDRLRNVVNRWIRNQTEADGMIDLDAALRDPDSPEQLDAGYDSGDGVHPGAAGYWRMGQVAAEAVLPLLAELKP